VHDANRENMTVRTASSRSEVLILLLLSCLRIPRWNFQNTELTLTLVGRANYERQIASKQELDREGKTQGLQGMKI
jgi:hypothetical protein